MFASHLSGPISLRTRFLRSIVARINATVVHRTIDSNPVGSVNPFRIFEGRACWKGGCDLDPAILFLRDNADLVGDFRQILILAQHQCDIERAAVR